jgi:FkbM family methyltransferase
LLRQTGLADDGVLRHYASVAPAAPKASQPAAQDHPGSERQKPTTAAKPHLTHSQVLSEYLPKISADGGERTAIVEVGLGLTSSTIAAYARSVNAKYYACDANADLIAAVRDRLSPDGFIDFRTGDSEATLAEVAKELATCHFVFLDGAPSATKTFREFLLLEPKLVPGSILVIDNAAIPGTDQPLRSPCRKGKILVPYLLASPYWEVFGRPNDGDSMVVAIMHAAPKHADAASEDIQYTVAFDREWHRRVPRSVTTTISTAPTTLQSLRSRLDYGMQIEVLVSALYHFLLKPGDIAIDAGSSGGLHTIPMASLVSPGGKIHAFEAQPGTAAWLARSFADRIPPGSLEAHGVALGDERATVEFIIDKSSVGLSHVRRPDEPLPDPTDQARALVKVPMVPLDTVLPEISGVTFMKIDVEGMDFRTMRGARRLIALNQPIITFENGSVGITDEEFFEFFERIGYEVYDLHNTPFDKANFGTPALTFQAVCGPHGSAELRKAQAVIEFFWSTLGKRSTIGSWKETRDICHNVFAYMVDNARF